MTVGIIQELIMSAVFLQTYGDHFQIIKLVALAVTVFGDCVTYFVEKVQQCRV